MASGKSSVERLADLIAELLADAADKAVDKAARKAVGEELALRMVEGTHQPMLYTIAETAALLGGVSDRWVWQQIADGNLIAVKLGRRTMVHADSVRRFVDDRVVR